MFLGDIDPEFNVVEVTEEAKQELAKIENKVASKVLHTAIREAPLSKKCSFFEHCSKGL